MSEPSDDKDAERSEPPDDKDAERSPLHDEICRLMQRLRDGDESARDPLISKSYDLLRRRARKLLRAFSFLRPLVDTDDVLQLAVIRLRNALARFIPVSLQHFFNVAHRHISWALKELARRQKPHGQRPPT